MRNYPLIYNSCDIQGQKFLTVGTQKERDKSWSLMTPEDSGEKGNFLIQDLWQKGKNSIRDMHFVNTETYSHVQGDPTKVFQESYNEKN